jgi:thiosulfate/3-mercaptopyruvate sulfurtransferase
MDSLVTTEWLAQEIGASDLRIVDASRHMAETGRDASAEYEAAHIPGAVFMDLGELVDTSADVENTLPSAAKFASRMQALGLGDGSRIVLYDDSAIHSAARAWYMLKLFGAHNIAILDGGLAKWRAEGRDLAAGKESLRHRHFTVWQDDKQLRAKADVLRNLATQDEQLIDARGAPRFRGDQPEPRPEIAAGHIPGSFNVPYDEMFRADGTFKDKAGIRAAFEAAGVDLSKPVVTTCGSGMTACVLAFGLDLLGKHDVALYDGSWAEWGGDAATPKELGAVGAD